MRCLIRSITRKGKDGIVHQDQEFTGERLTIGRGADRDLFLSDLRVALEHAFVTEAGKGQFLITATAPSGVRVNSEVLSSAVLSTGDVVGIGNFEVTVREPERGYDLRLDVEQVRTARGKELEEALKRRSKIGLAATHLRRRRWAWLSFLVILIVTFALPVTGFFVKPAREALRSAFVVSDSFWDPGPLAPAHRFFGRDCNVCHESAFRRVRDSACIACHKNTHAHTDPVIFASANMTGTRCEDCHQDHQGGRSFIRRDEDLCSDCHRNLKAIMPKTMLENVSDFGDGHPEFRPTMLSVVDGKPVSQRLPLNQPGLEEHSNLKFPHEKHLKKEGVKVPTGGRRVLVCGDCHVPEPGGKRMQPIDFEKDCHSCHLLTFDKLNPKREVPHGKTQEVLFTLQEYYASRALQGGYPAADAPPVVRTLRRPGSPPLTGEERTVALDWVREMTGKVGRELFQYRACATCHTVTQVPEPAGAGTLPVWKVAPVRIASHWLPLAEFDHSKHLTMDCVDCHDAPKSKKSEDVLIEGIASCRKCHGGAHATKKLASTCVDCHGFHISKKFVMGSTATEIAAAAKRKTLKERK